LIYSHLRVNGRVNNCVACKDSSFARFLFVVIEPDE